MIGLIRSLTLAMLLSFLSIPAAMAYSSCSSHYDNCGNYENPMDSFSPFQEEAPPPPEPPEEEEKEKDAECSRTAGKTLGAILMGAGGLLMASGTPAGVVAGMVLVGLGGAVSAESDKCEG